MDYFKIKGGKSLHGNINVSGSKNAALPIITASILSKKPFKLTNLPRLSDVDSILKLMVELGANVNMYSSGASISCDVLFGEKSEYTAPYDIVRKMRASILVLGPLLARYGVARVSMPGGCAIGARPVDLHLMVMEKLGAKIQFSGGYINATCKELHGNEIIFPFVSVGASQAAIMTASMAKGTSIIKNISQEPETTQLAEILCTMGANIKGIGTDTLTIEGVGAKTLRGTDEVLKIIPDRIEAGTYAIACAGTFGDITINNLIPEHLDILWSHLRETGVEIAIKENSVRVNATKLKSIKAIDVVTAPYPGFPTDLQAQWMAYMTVADGTATIIENIFENRYIHVSELLRLGARVKKKGVTATIKGTKKLLSAPVMASDLRASASLVIAGLIAEGTTEVHRVYHIDRGYERIDEKLALLGADIERLSEGKIWKIVFFAK